MSASDALGGQWFHVSDSPEWKPEPRPMHVGDREAAEHRARIVEEQGVHKRTYLHALDYDGPEASGGIHRDDVANFVSRTGRRGGAHRELVYEDLNESWGGNPKRQLGRLGKQFHVEGRAIRYENAYEAEGSESLVVPDATKLKHRGVQRLEP